MPPGPNDVVTFSPAWPISDTVTLNSGQSAMGLAIGGNGSVMLQDGGTNQTLSLGVSGITAAGTARVVGVGVNVSLVGSQTWAFGGSNNEIGNGIFLYKSVSAGVAGEITLTLGGSTGNLAVSNIQGTISDGGGTLHLTMNGAANNRWILRGSNSYSGVTTISGGAPGITAASALGSTSAGTTVTSGGALFLRNTSDVVYAPEPLAIAGIGPTGSTRGALRQVDSGTTATWTGAITANATAGSVRIGSDASNSTLTFANSATITTTGANQLQFDNSGAVFVNGAISGSAALAKVSTGAGVLTLAGSNAYTGATIVNGGVLAVTGSLDSTSSVTVGSAGSLRGTGTIHSLAPVSVSGTLSGAATFQRLALSASAISPSLRPVNSSSFNSAAGTSDLINMTGNLSLDSGNAATLSLNDLSAASITGGSYIFIDYSGTWNGGLFKVGGTVIGDNANTFSVAGNIYQIDYDFGGVNGAVALIAVPEPGAAISLTGGLAMLLGIPRLRRGRSHIDARGIRPGECAGDGGE